MYYIIDIDKFVVIRGPFIELQQALNALAACRLRIKECYIVKGIDTD